MNIDFHKIDYTRGATFFVMIFAFIAGPFLFIFEFQRELFYRLDLLRLIIFSISVGFPLVTINIIISMEVNEAQRKTDPKQSNTNKSLLRIEGVALGCFFSLFVFYVPCALTFFAKLTFKDAIYIALGIEILVLLFMYLAILDYRRISKETPPVKSD